MKNIILTLIAILSFSVSFAQNVSNIPSDATKIHTDTIHAQKKPFFRWGNCLGLSLSNTGNSTSINGSSTIYSNSRPAGHGLYSFIDGGVTLTNRIKIDLELDDQNNGYLQITNSNTNYVTTSTENNTSLFLIPNIIITANKKKFTPYCRIGPMISIINITMISNSVDYYNLGISQSETSHNNAVEAGVLLAGGIDIQLFKSHDYIFGEGYLNQIMITNNSGGESESSIGIDLGFKIDWSH